MVEVDLKGLALPLAVVVQVVDQVVSSKYDDVKIDYSRGVLHCYPKTAQGVGDKIAKRLEQARYEAPYRGIDVNKYIEWNENMGYVISPLDVYPFGAQHLRALAATLHQHRKVKGVRHEGMLLLVTTRSGKKDISLRSWMASTICHKAGTLSRGEGA